MVSFNYLSTVLMSGWRVTTIIMLLHHNIAHVHTSDFFCMKYNFSSCWHLTNSLPLKIDSFSKSALSKLCPCFPHKCPFGLSSMLFTGDLGLHVNAQESNIFSWTNFLFVGQKYIRRSATMPDQTKVVKMTKTTTRFFTKEYCVSLRHASAVVCLCFF